MSKLSYWFYSSWLWTRLLNLSGRVTYGPYVRPNSYLTLKDAQSCVGAGWAELIKIGFRRCQRKGARIYQIKEKFGTLRFYTDARVNVEDIEKLSQITCERCGRFGEYREGGWVKTLCLECNERRKHGPQTTSP